MQTLKIENAKGEYLQIEDTLSQWQSIFTLKSKLGVFSQCTKVLLLQQYSKG